MTDTKTIPADIDLIATGIVRAPLNGEEEPDFALYLLIASALSEERERATLAERERCKRIAQSCPITLPLAIGTADGASMAGRQIVSAIARP